MNDRRCRYCQRAFRPASNHPQQFVCSEPECQRQRRRDYHRHKIASDPVYRQVCLESPRKWREAHPGYWEQYRQTHPEQVVQNRQRQRRRDQKRRLVNLVNNLAFNLEHLTDDARRSGQSASHLANNNLANGQVVAFHSHSSFETYGSSACQQQPFGLAPISDL